MADVYCPHGERGGKHNCPRCQAAEKVAKIAAGRDQAIAEIIDLKSFVVKLRGKADPQEWQGMNALTARLAIAEHWLESHQAHDHSEGVPGVCRICNSLQMEG